MKKLLKGIITAVAVIIVAVVVLFVVLSIKNSIDSRKPQLTNDYYMGFKSDSPLEKKYSGLGDCEVAMSILTRGIKQLTNTAFGIRKNLKVRSGNIRLSL